MRKIFIPFFTIGSLLLYTNTLLADNYPDQHHISQIKELSSRIESQDAIQIRQDSTCFVLADSAIYGYVTLEPDSSVYPFNRGLPSWNGSALDENCGFMVQMRFSEGSGWSPWLTVGYWKAYIWSSYGATSYPGGYVDYDYVKLNQYQNRWQFRVHLARHSLNDPSPTIHTLSFYISDTGTTEATDYTALLNDNPEELFIPTDFLYQYDIDDDIGPIICSPTSVSMALLSFDISVDPLQFARDTYDPYYGIFGIWPRVVQNASEYGLEGTVTRYRSWSATRAVLAAGGRIVISVGPPLYDGHLMMLAGFTATGDPIVHDPAKQDGYAKVYDKHELALSWFSKGGIAYTFFRADEATAVQVSDVGSSVLPGGYQLFQNYPNPFNPTTTIEFVVPELSDVTLAIYDIRGRLIKTLYQKKTQPGSHTLVWNTGDLASGHYFVVLSTPVYQKVLKAILLR